MQAAGDPSQVHGYTGCGCVTLDVGNCFLNNAKERTLHSERQLVGLRVQPELDGEPRASGTLYTMTYYGSQMVVEHYNMMGPVKAALESATRYLPAELGPKGIRVHAISPGPLKTRAASGITAFDELLQKAQSKAPSRSLVSIDDVGAAVAFLGTNAAKLITGETLYIDGGYHIID
jgi:NAD(P)-dependent dehydrogenase (short-subunit alcohol dehydrogenase family)